MQPYIRERGEEIAQSIEYLKDPLLFTSKLLGLYEEFSHMIELCFGNKSLFLKTRDRAFLEFLNEQNCSAPYIATFVDHEMKKGFKGVGDVEVEVRLNAIICLFQCLHARDMFMKSYERDFA